MADFLSDLAGREATIAWAQQMLTTVDASEHAKQNALLVLERLGVQAHRGSNWQARICAARISPHRNLELRQPDRG